eukprot:SM000029S10489  [mRNA]  locus=s29:423592:424691:+ [translate_table: standard]
MEALGSSLAVNVLAFLDAQTLATCAAVSREWRAVSRDDVLWRAHCKELWQDKFHVPPRAADPSTPRHEAYQLALQDCKRATITLEDLCRCAWDFRFKPQAGEYWMSLDPFWQGLPSMQRVFHANGTVSAHKMDVIYGSHECTWRFTKSKEGKPGTYIRINHWPSLIAARTKDWGWTLENCWVKYHSTRQPPHLTPEATPEAP